MTSCLLPPLFVSHHPRSKEALKGFFLQSGQQMGPTCCQLKWSLHLFHSKRDPATNVCKVCNTEFIGNLSLGQVPRRIFELVPRSPTGGLSLDKFNVHNGPTQWTPLHNGSSVALVFKLMTRRPRVRDQ
ncbi:hypothetical protein TNCV_4449591 [Trichonephila clavipes]|nr:hypothetical protein TNCV_4449591 [Trichonephila clavipes]